MLPSEYFGGSRLTGLNPGSFIKLCIPCTSHNAKPWREFSKHLLELGNGANRYLVTV